MPEEVDPEVAPADQTVEALEAEKAEEAADAIRIRDEMHREIGGH
jgi:hypothetical protein